MVQVVWNATLRFSSRETPVVTANPAVTLTIPGSIRNNRMSLITVVLSTIGNIDCSGPVNVLTTASLSLVLLL